MKSIVIILCACAHLVSGHCLAADTDTQRHIFKASVGAYLDTTRSEQLISHYVTNNAVTTKVSAQDTGERHNTIRSHFFGSSIYQDLLSYEGATGLWFVYAIDDKGQPQILLVPADQYGSYLRANNKVIVADESYSCPESCGLSDVKRYGADPTKYESLEKIQVGNQISETAMQTWVANYRSQISKDTIRAHFFGRDIIEELLLASTDVVGIRIHYAMTTDGRRKMLLSPEHLYSTALEIQTAKTNQMFYANESYACPDHCGRDD